MRGSSTLLSGGRRWPATPAHTALWGLFALALPALSWLDGSGAFAWTMFSKSEAYRLEIEIVDAAGGRRATFQRSARRPSR